MPTRFAGREAILHKHSAVRYQIRSALWMRSKLNRLALKQVQPKRSGR